MEYQGSFYEFILELDKSTIVAFVKEHSGMPERMRKVYEKTKELSGADIRRMSPEEVLMIRHAVLSLNPHIFILNNFDGEAYSYLSSIESSHLILGVPLLETIYDKENKKQLIRNKHRQIFNAAFSGITLCISNIRSAEKRELSRILKLMNGRLSVNVDANVTHLVTNTTKSVKYSEATALKIPVYHYFWVQSVWKKCLRETAHNINANSDQFDSYKLPPFFGLKISCSGVPKETRGKLETLIEENGGEFSETYSSTETDILLLNEKDSSNPKYQNAVKRRIPILKCSWAEESAKAGYSLPYDDFCFKSSSKSSANSHKRTKTEEQEQRELLSSSSSDISTLQTENENNSSCSSSSHNITVSSISTLQRIPSVTSIASNALRESKNTSIEFIKNFAVAQLKKLDNFLDGYTLYLKDYPQEIVAKMRRIITRCGGSSVEGLNENFTHIVCYGDVNRKSLHKMMVEKNIYAIPVRAEWLLQCLTQMKPLLEMDYIIDLSAEEKSARRIPPSPFSKKTIQMVREIERERRRDMAKRAINLNGSADDERVELKQTSIEATHKKIKQPPTNVTRAKRPSEEDISELHDIKRQKLFDLC